MKKDMQHVLSSVSKRRTILVAWLTAWMLAVPLVHVHPEADHHHGAPGHVHGGISHTVFSSDLPCEYSSNHDGRVVVSADAKGYPAVGGQSTHPFDHPEITFSLLTSAPEWDSWKPAFVGVVITVDERLSPPGACFATGFSLPSLTSALLSADLSARGPPAVSL